MSVQSEKLDRPQAYSVSVVVELIANKCED